MPKSFHYLIIVWSIVCASGLGIFLFQIFAPAVTPQTAYDARDLVFAVAFFLFLWAVPVAIAAIKGRQAGRKNSV